MLTVGTIVRHKDRPNQIGHIRFQIPEETGYVKVKWSKRTTKILIADLIVEAEQLKLWQDSETTKQNMPAVLSVAES